MGSLQRILKAYFDQEAVRGTDNRSMPEMYNLVEDVLRNPAFANYVYTAPVVVVETKPVVEVKEQPQVVEVKVESRKESAARKDSEAQQQMFMEDDSEDEREVREQPAPVVQVKVTVTEQETVTAPKEEKKIEKKVTV